ncbi:MAG: 30S ribosomal protein S6 [Holophagales bacterium]|nr:30S ribosomal protein S6 [Holophagales bacterium]
MTETPKRLYDLVFLIVPEKDEQGAAEVVEEYRKLLTDLGAIIDKDESIGRRRLAYQINKKTEATYHNFLFRAGSKAVNELQRKMKLSENVLRYLTVRIDEEMRHGQKIARRVKARPSRALPASPESAPAPAPVSAAVETVPAPEVAPAAEPAAASAPVPAPEVAAAPEAAADAPVQPES